MSKYVTTCSTNTVNGNEVNINIKVSSPEGKFDLDGIIEIHGLSNIIDGKITAKFKKNSGSPSEFKYNKNGQYYYYEIRQKFTNLSSFDIIITGDKKPDFENSEHLRVVIPVVGGDAETVNFEVFAPKTPFSIQEFKAKNSIIQKGRNTLELNYEIEGEGVELTLFENAQKCNGNIQQSSIKIEFGDSKLSGLYEYTLQATKGEQMVSKSITIIYVEESTVRARTIPDKKIVNFCAAQNGEYLFALTSDNNKKLEICYTDQIGGDKNWSTINISDQVSAKRFVNSPMLHLQSDKEREDGSLGRIVLIGGSMIRKVHEDDANQVAIIDLGRREDNTSIHETLPEGSFFHSCVLFPKGDNTNTIWLLGGQNEYGEVSNKIWTSVDGINWEKENDAPWAARCMASASVSWKYDENNGKKRIKEAIWLAGGFERYESSGEVIPDVWKYQNNAWTKIDIPIKQYKALALAYGGVEEDNKHTGIYLFGTENNTSHSPYSSKLKHDNQSSYFLKEFEPKIMRNFDHHNQGTYITAFFRECLWVMGLCDSGSSGNNYSDFYYRIPTIHDFTINFDLN